MLSVLTSLTLMLSSFGVVAQIDPGDASDEVWVETTTIWVFLEIDAIAASGAFEPSVAVERIQDELGTGLVDRDEIVETIAEYDADNQELLVQLMADGRVLSPVLEKVLGLLPPVVTNRIQAGDQGFLDAGPWLEAIADLWVRGGAAPRGPRPAGERRITDLIFGRVGDGDDGGGSLEAGSSSLSNQVTEPGAASAVGLDAALDTTDPAPDVQVDEVQPQETEITSDVVVAGSSSAGSSFPQVPVVIVAILALAAIAWLANQRMGGRVSGSRGERHGRGDGTGDLVEVGRQMTAALDVDQVARIAVAEGVRLSSAAAGAYVRVVNGVARFTETSSEGLFSGEPIEAGALWRVIETGQPAAVVLRNEAALCNGSMAVAATPVIADGSVSGAIVVVRSALDPFSRQQLDQLTALAPITGTAMTAALAHRSALSDADIDGLTQLKNRRRLDKDLARLPRGATVGFAMVDIDHFKNFNDTNGHPAGDAALKSVADCIARTVRAGDSVYRYGGEEFSVVLVGADEAEAVEVMERVRAAVEVTEITGEENQPGGKVTISVGVVISTPTEPEARAFATSADAALYRAKHDGRNRVVVA